MELSSPKIKKTYIFSRETFFIFREMEPIKKVPHISEGDFPSSKEKKKKFLYFGKWNTLASYFSYISGNGTFSAQD